MTKKNHETNNKAKNRSIGSTSNTYVSSTRLNSCSIDYLKFKINTHMTEEEIIEELLSLSLFEMKKAYKNNEKIIYETAYEHRRLPIKIHYHGTSTKICCHVEIKGTACAQLRDDRLQDIIKKAIALNAKFERIDLLRDDLKGLLEMSEIELSADKGYWTGTAQKSKREENKDKQGNGFGVTVYFGSKKSPIYIRIYDKAKEQGEDHHWLRCEIQFQFGAANDIAHKIANTDSIGKLFAGVLRGKLNFRIPSATDSNRYRWEIQDWWLKFIGECETVKVTTRHENQIPNKKKERRYRQIAGDLSDIYLSKGEAGIIALIEEGNRIRGREPAKVRWNGSE